jgi:hypothetical protein
VDISIKIHIDAVIHIHGDSQEVIDKINEVTAKDKATTDKMKEALNNAETGEP